MGASAWGRRSPAALSW